MDINVAAVHHIMITVDDLDVAKHFYGTVLGLKDARCPVDDGERVWFKLGAQELHVNLSQECKTGDGHFALSIEPNKYHDYIESIKSRGCENMTEPHKYIDGFYRVYIKDPSGNFIEIIDAQVAA